MSTREEFWRGALSELSASGQSMRQFCREHHLDYHRALYWRRRLEEQARWCRHEILAHTAMHRIRNAAKKEEVFFA